MEKFIHFKLQDGTIHPKTFNSNLISSIEQHEKYSTLRFKDGNKQTVIESKDEIIKLLNTTESEITLTLFDKEIYFDFSFI